MAVLRCSAVDAWLCSLRDVFTDPKPILGDVAAGLANPLDYPKVAAVTVLFSGFLVATYFVFYAVARLMAPASDESHLP